MINIVEPILSEQSDNAALNNGIVEIFTDGACKGNPGAGGWGVLLRCGKHEKTLAGGEDNTTNNRMELLAAIQGLEALNKSCRVILTTDSQYVKQGITQWLAGWKKKGWKTASGSAVKNQDLWQRLEATCQAHEIEWRWVKGHSGHHGNEVVDKLASGAAEQIKQQRIRAC